MAGWAVHRRQRRLLALSLGDLRGRKNCTDPDEPRYLTRYGRAAHLEETIRVASST